MNDAGGRMEIYAEAFNFKNILVIVHICQLPLA